MSTFQALIALIIKRADETDPWRARLLRSAVEQYNADMRRINGR